MKVGILTYHDGINHGAYLQMYALYRVIERLGFEPEIINYKSYNHWKWEYKCFLWTKNPRLFYDNLIKIIKFKRKQRLLQQSKFTFNANAIPNYDKVVIGSDEIWNFVVNHSSEVYFGVGLNANLKIAYAPSFGSVKNDAIISSNLLDGIKRIDYLSVRDKNSLNIMERNFPDRHCEKVVDPTFLFDFVREEITPVYSNYILIYTTGIAEDIQKKIIKFARANNKKLIAIGYKTPWCDINKISIDPFEWLGFFKNADMVITTMFHGTIFSIKYEKEFCTILEPYRINKIKDMLEELELKNRLYCEECEFEKVFSDRIDYEKVNLILNNEIKKSEAFLRASLNS